MARETFRSDFRRCLISGLAALLPVTLTIFILWQTFVIVDRYARPISDLMFSALFGGRTNRFLSTLASMVLVILIVYLVGRFAATYIGRFLLRIFERLMLTFPVIKAIYPYTKQITDFIFADKTKRFGRTVAIEYPRKGIYALGFITSESPATVNEKTGKKYFNIFVPSSPTPFTGYVVFVSEDEIIDLDMTPDEAIRLTVSGGVIVPDKVKSSKPNSKDVDTE